MNDGPNLQELLAAGVAANPDGVAVEEPAGASITYAELDRLSDLVRDRLRALGVERGDRVGLYMRKSIDAVLTVVGILKAGAAYVPVDPEAPSGRCAFILRDCAVALVVTEKRLEQALISELAQLGAQPVILALEEADEPVRWRSVLAGQSPAAGASSVRSSPDDLAYLLYTSGSTGRPKGVQLTHRAARCFTDWCAREFHPSREDVYSSHAPLHFDLSIHDVFVSLGHGARLVLITEQLGKDPMALAEVIAERGITVWYSTPSILNLLAVHGKLERYDFSALRLVLFAGEVFPIPQLRTIKERWIRPKYFNLYGPTETNVCTYYEVPAEIDRERASPFPIGRICPPLRGRVVDESGRDVELGAEGELIIHGPGVMVGYWNQPERNRHAFLEDETGARWYRTGDLVTEDSDGIYQFHGRRDRMVKRRGYRIELGEIEAGLAAHPDVREVAVVATTGADGAVRINANLVLSGSAQPSVIGFKRYCMEHLPTYMVPDTFTFRSSLPRTSTDKIDYQGLLLTQ